MTGRRSGNGLWLRWSWRDLRRRWVSVLVIGLIIAIGTGVYAGLGSTSEWRRQSNDASFAVLEMHDLRIELSAGTYAGAGELLDVVAGIDHADWVDAVAERLIVPTQVDASTPSETILVPGELVGTDLGSDGRVDLLDLDEGRLPAPGTTELVLELKFARHYDLAPDGLVALAGGTEVPYVGHGVTPEDFIVTGLDEGSFLAEANFAVLYGSVEAVQELSGLGGRVNDLVLTLTPDADVELVAAELESALSSAGGISAVVTDRRDSEAYRLLYDDIEGDQKLWTVLSLMVVIAAAIASFNLVARIVEAQRREIGIQMALGIEPARLALRPLLVGGQIALLGAVLGVGVGLLVGGAMRSLLVEVLPLPIWRTPFQYGVYLQAAAIGFLVPFAASVYPVWRAVRVEPIEAIRTGHLAAKTSKLAAAGARVRLPGSSIGQLPVRNVLRTPRRTVLTALGVGVAIAALVGVLGLLDSFIATIRTGEDEITKDVGDRVTVALDGFRAEDDAQVGAIAGLSAVGQTDSQLRLPAMLAPDDDRLGAFVTILDFDTAAWTPTVEDAADVGDRPGIVLARKAADDLGLAPGDPLVVQHPRRAGTAGYELVETVFAVRGTHPNPLRAFAYVDRSDVAVFGLQGIVNTLEVRPASGTTVAELQRQLFTQPAVASAQPITATSDAFDEALDQFLGFLIITASAVLVLAMLIAFNTTSISVDERAREHATLFAFGIRVRTVVRLITVESVLIGLAATTVGIGFGYLILRWMVESLVGDTLPELGFEVTLAPTTLAIAIVVGVLAVGLTPLLLGRRLQRMNIPDTLRVME